MSGSKEASVHRSLELLEEYHAELFRASDTELKMAIERVINVFKNSLFNALCDIHDFYENVLLNERIPVGEKIFESRRFAARWERPPPPSAAAVVGWPSGPSPIKQPPPFPLSQAHIQPPSRPSSRKSFGPPAETFLQTSPINRIVDENGREWVVEEVLLDVSRSGLGFSISGGRDREPDPVYFDRYIRVTDISPGGAVQKDGRIQVGDVLLRVNDWDTANCDHDYAVQALKNAGAFVRLLVKRLKPIAASHAQFGATANMQRSLSQSHLMESVLTTPVAGGFQRTMSGVTGSRQFQAGTLQPPIRSQSLHQLPVVAAGSSSAGGTLPRRQPQQQQQPPAAAMPPTVQFTPTMPEPGKQPRWVALRKTEHGLGFNIVGGEDGEPIYISFVIPGGAADLNGNVRQGDVLLQVNDVNLASATHGEAAVALKAIPVGSHVQLLLQYRPKDFRYFEDKVERARMQMQPPKGYR